MQEGSKDREHGEQIVEALELLFVSGVVSRSGHGNLSSRLDSGHLLLAPGPMVRNVELDDLIVVSSGPTVERGDGCAADVVEMHQAVYRARPDSQAVLHTHSPSVTAFAMANRPLPCRYETLHRFGGQVGEVPVAPWTPGRRDHAFLKGIDDAVADHPGTRAVLLANHGVLTFGSSPRDAAMVLIALEEAAEAEIGAAALGGARDFPVPMGGASRDR